MYTLKELKLKGVSTLRTERTGDWTRNRNGKRVPVMVNVEYVGTEGAGELRADDWIRYMDQAVEKEGKGEAIRKIKAYCKRNCAWIRTEKALHEYALQCLSEESYLNWEGFI